MKQNKKGEATEVLAGLFCFGVIFGLLAIVFAFSIVGYDEYAIEEEFGSLKGEFKDQGITYVGFGSLIRINNQVRNYEIKADGYSKDKQKTVLDLTLNLQIKKEFTKDYIKNYRSEEVYAKYLTNKVQEKVKTIISKYKAEDFIDNRENISKELKESLVDVKELEYFEFKDVSIENVDYSEEFKEILERKAKVNIERDIIMKQRQNNIELRKNIDELDIDAWLKYQVGTNYKGETLIVGGEFLK